MVILTSASYTVVTKVGPKGQVVIDQEIREQLGIEAGMLAVQRVVGDHVELRFVAGAHSRSLAGVLRPYLKSRPELRDPAALDEAITEAWAEEASERYRKTLPSSTPSKRPAP